MNYFVVILVASFSSLTVKGQCPVSVASSAITTCDGSSKAGTQVYIDFNKINSPCTCIVIPSISGKLNIMSKKATASACTTVIKVGNELAYRCPPDISLTTHKVIANQRVTVTASYEPDYNSGPFYHCLGFDQLPDGVKVACGSVSTTHTTTVNITSTRMSSAEMNVSPTHHHGFTTVSDTLLMKSTKPPGDELTYIIAGAGGGFAVIIMILIIVICVRMRKKSPVNKSARGELDTEHKNYAYDREADLPYNPLYHSNQREEVEEQDHKALPPLQTNNDHSHNAKSPETYKQSEDHTPDIPVYAIPNKPKNTPTETAGGAVYAQINKPKKNTAQTPVRIQNQEGLVYMEVEHSDDPITQNAPHINVSSAENVTYAEIQK